MWSRWWFRRNFISFSIALSVWLALAVAYLYEEHSAGPGLVGSLEAKMVDLRFGWRGPRPVVESIAIVAIDSASIRERGRWPWSRMEQARLLDKLRQAGAKTVAFDIMFAEPETPEILQLIEEIQEALPPPASGGREPLASVRRTLDSKFEEVQADRQFAAAMERCFAEDLALPVLPFRFQLSRTDALRFDPPSSEDQRILSEKGSFGDGPEYSRVRLEGLSYAWGFSPITLELARASDRVGFVNRRPGNVARESWVAFMYSPAFRDLPQAAGPAAAAVAVDDLLESEPSSLQALMSLPVAAVATHLRLAPGDMKLDLENGLLAFSPPGSPDSKEYRFDKQRLTAGIDYYGPAKTIAHHSYLDVMNDNSGSSARPIINADAFRDKLVFIGVTDPGAYDIFSTPTAAEFSGVEQQATVAANILEARELHYHADETRITLLTSLAAAVLAAFVVGNVGALAALGILAFLTASCLRYSFEDFAEQGLLWNLAMPGLTLALSYLLVTSFRFRSEALAKRQVRAAFSTYLSEPAVREIMTDPDRLELGGERRVCTVLYADLVGSAALVRSIPHPEDLVRLMNRYLSRMTDVILDQDGMVDKFIGHAILAVFGAPIPRSDHAARACCAALRCVEALRRLRIEIEAEGLPAIDCGIGIYTGEAVIGSIGSKRRMDYTAFGSPVDLARRLEGANKQFRTHIVVGEQTRKQALVADPEFAFRPLDAISLRRGSEGLEHQPDELPVYQLVGKEKELPEATAGTLEAYHNAFATYREGRFAEAAESFEAVLQLAPEDGPSSILCERCRQLAKRPPPTWTGVFRVTGSLQGGE